VLTVAPASILAAGFVQAQEPIGSEMAWTVVKEWTGETGQKTTETFSAPSRPWRISFKSVSGEKFGVIDIFVRTRDGALVTAAPGQQRGVEGNISGSFVVDAEHEEYYLEINSYGLAWNVAIEKKP
jgi:hypothetical protein